MTEMSQALINRIIENRKRGKKHHIIINAEGNGHSSSMAKRIEAATGIETRGYHIGPYAEGRRTLLVRTASMLPSWVAKAVELLCEGKEQPL